MILPSQRQVELARPADVRSLHRLRQQLESWLARKEIQQWPRGEVSQQDIAVQVGRQEWHLVRNSAAGVAAAMRVLRSDPDIWGADNTPAVYIHGLMVDRSCAGLGLGTLLLHRAAEAGRQAGAAVCRLDCVETNRVLRSYYRRQGFREVGRRDFQEIFSATLFEKAI